MKCAMSQMVMRVSAVFVCDVLDVDPGDGEQRAQDVLAALTKALEAVSPGVKLSSRIL